MKLNSVVGSSFRPGSSLCFSAGLLGLRVVSARVQPQPDHGGSLGLGLMMDLVVARLGGRVDSSVDEPSHEWARAEMEIIRRWSGWAET